MGRLEFAPILPRPVDYENRFNRVNHLLDREGLSLLDLQEKGEVLLAPSFALKDYIGLLAAFDRLMLVVDPNGEEVLRTSGDRDRLMREVRVKEKASSELRGLLSQRKLVRTP